MTRRETVPAPSASLEPRASRRVALLTGLVSVATLGGVLLAVAHPE